MDPQVAPPAPQPAPAVEPAPTPTPTPAPAAAPSREQMVNDLRAAQAQQAAPSREQMVADLRAAQAVPAEQSPADALNGMKINPDDYANSAAPLTAKAAIGALPAAGMIAGGMLAGSAGAIAGGAGGALLKNYIENTIVGGKGTADQMLTETTDAATSAGLGEATAGVLPSILKAATPTAASLLSVIPKSDIATWLSSSGDVKQMLNSTEVGGSISKMATLIQAKIASAVTNTVGNLEKPAWDAIGAKTSTLSDSEAGQQVKNLLISDLKEQHGPFLDAYGKLGEVNQNIQLPDADRYKLSEGLKTYALDEFESSPETYRTLKQIADNVNASTTGKSITPVLNDVRTQLTVAYKTGDTNAIQALSETQGRIESFMDGQVTGLASRVAKGTASPADYAAFQKMADANGVPQGENLAQYAKEIGDDYLQNKDKVAQDYSGLKDYLNFVQQTTGAKKSIGVGTLVKNIQAIPNEKLITRMFNPDNAASLQRMSEETPEVFAQIAGQEIKGMNAQATVDGTLSLPKFVDQMNALPKEVRNLLFSADEQATLMQTRNNPKLQRLYEMTGQVSSDSATVNPALIKPGSDETALISAGSGRDSQVHQQLSELSQLTGQNLMRDAQQLSAAQSLGKASFGDALSKRSGVMAAAGAEAGHLIAPGTALGPVLGAAGGAVAGAATSPIAVKAGLNTLGAMSSPGGQAAVQAGTSGAAQTLGQVIHGGAGARAIQQNQPGQAPQ